MSSRGVVGDIIGGRGGRVSKREVTINTSKVIGKE